MNPAYSKMTGYTAEESIGKTPRILQGPLTDKNVLKRLRRALQAGEVFEGEAINYRKDGREFDFEWQVAPVRSSGAITHFVAIQRDITMRKRLEAKLYRSQNMEAVGKLAGGVAHEFNSIMTAIIGQSELLLSDMETGDSRGNSEPETATAGGEPLSDHVRGLHPEVRVLFTSSRADASFSDRNAGTNAFLQKPFSPGALARKVREVLDSTGVAA